MPRDNYALPVSRDGFFHSGDSFYVKLDQHRHERKERDLLYGLLTYTTPAPLLTKAGKISKRQPPPHKDPPDHFYRAQLLHYGLKPLKTKDAAKKRLLAAFSTDGTLAVPKNILQLEKSLKKEYTRANEIAKEEYHQKKSTEKIEEDEQRKKRKRHNDAVWQAVMDDDDSASGYPNADSEDSDPVVEPAAKRTKSHNAIAGSSRSGVSISENRLTNKNPGLERGVKAGKPQRSLGTGIGNSSKSAIKVEKAKKAKTKKKSPALDSTELEGQFEIVAPDLSSECPDSMEPQMTLKMGLSSTSSHLWASFDFGIVSGIIRSSSLPSRLVAGAAYPFLWRGQESGEGQMSFGPGNTGSITFLGGGKIKGTIRWLGGFEFVGKRVERRNVVWSKSVPGWKSQWRGINLQSYERARVGRWGGGSWGGREDVPESNSDTN